MNYKNLYLRLFNAITRATDELEKETEIVTERNNAINILKTAQIDTEEMYLCENK